jgi:metallophosphoesterase superfamily enzyme
MEIVFDDRALLLKGRNENVLVVSDIHLGYEAELAERGAEFPVQHHEMLGRLLHLLDIHSVDRLFIIGDVKHTITVDKQHNWSVIPEFMERLASRAATTVIPGAIRRLDVHGGSWLQSWEDRSLSGQLL